MVFFHEVEKNVHCILEKNVALHEEGIIKERLLPKLKSMFIAYRNWKWKRLFIAWSGKECSWHKWSRNMNPALRNVLMYLRVSVLKENHISCPWNVYDQLSLPVHDHWLIASRLALHAVLFILGFPCFTFVQWCRRRCFFVFKLPT